jgi:sterol desaturase/sphingolipid hydroxylase (fatty acid hydroxylase superfamily)
MRSRAVTRLLLAAVDLSDDLRIAHVELAIPALSLARSDSFAQRHGLTHAALFVEAVTRCELCGRNSSALVGLPFFEVADIDPIGLKVILITCLVFVPLERLFALHREQKIFRRAWGNDLIFLFLNGLLTKLGLLAVIAATMFAALHIVPTEFQIWIGGLPYWVQIPLIIVLSDLGAYWTHRMFHGVPWLWRFHAIHHSSEELDWPAAVRVHPVDQILTRGVSLVPIVALGFSEWSIGVYALLYQWQSFLIHANVRFRFGPLRLLFASPEFHHWHHSNDRDARDKNFAGQLPFLDALFGTLHVPRGCYQRRMGWTGRCRSVTHSNCCTLSSAMAWISPNQRLQ